MSEEKLKIVTFGDHDTSGVEVYKKLLTTEYDLLLLLGDYSYDIDDDFGLRGDEYFDWMEPLLTRAPVVVVAGNHENFDDSRMLNNRFMMPGTRDPDHNNLFAWETLTLQALGLNLDFLLSNPDLVSDYSDQVEQQMQDFASRKDGRVTLYMSHRPFHSKKNYDEAEMLNSKFARIEKALIENQVNLNLWGHVHRYEHLVGIYQHKQVREESLASLIVGTGGNKEGLGSKADPDFSSGDIDDPTKKAICIVERGFEQISIFEDRLVASFYSVDESQVKDTLVMYTQFRTAVRDATLLWVFAVVLGLCVLFVGAYLVMILVQKRKKTGSRQSDAEGLILLDK